MAKPPSVPGVNVDTMCKYKCFLMISQVTAKTSLCCFLLPNFNLQRPPTETSRTPPAGLCIVTTPKVLSFLAIVWVM